MADYQPPTTVEGQDWAVQDYRSWLLTVAKASPATVATTLTALQAFYDYPMFSAIWTSTGRSRPNAPPGVGRCRAAAPVAGQEACGSTHDHAVLLVLYATGVRVAELAALDVDDVPLTARTGVVIVRSGKGADGRAYREVPSPPIPAWRCGPGSTTARPDPPP